MSDSSIGKLFKVTTFGESHGKGIGCIVDGCPPNLELSEADLQPDLDRRKPGQSKFTTQRREADEVHIYSGVFDGKTTGTSIGMVIENTDQKSKDYSNIMDTFRPGHADYTYHHKYGNRDYRGGGRSSARTTAMIVAAGGIAKKYLRVKEGVEVRGYLAQMGAVKIDSVDNTSKVVREREVIFDNTNNAEELYILFRSNNKSEVFYITVNIPSAGKSKKFKDSDFVCIGMLLEHRRTKKSSL